MATFANEGNINWNGNWQKVTKADALHASTNLNVDSGSTQYSGYWTGAASSTDHGCLAYLSTLTTLATGRTITCTLESDDNTDFSSPTAEQTATYVTTSATKLLTWIHFKFGSTEAEDSSTPLYYRYKFVTDNADDTGFRAAAAAATKVAVVQILNETGTLAATDVTYIVGAGTQTSGNPDAATVTVNINSNDDYGACTIGNGGILSFRTDASTTTQLDFAGAMTGWNGGSLLIGSTGTKIPSTSSATLRFNSGSNYQYGLFKYVGFTLQVQGESPTGYKTYLTADIATGTIKEFAVNDASEIAVGQVLYLCYSMGNLANSTDELVTVTGKSGNTIYIDTTGDGTGTGVSLGNHHGHAEPQGLVVPMLRPARIESQSTTYLSYIYFESSESNYDADFDGASFYRMALGINTEWYHWGFKASDIATRYCYYYGSYHYWPVSGDYVFDRWITFQSSLIPGRVHYSWGPVGLKVTNSIFGNYDLGGNTALWNQPSYIVLENVDLLTMSSGGGSVDYIAGNCGSVDVTNLTVSNCGSLIAPSFYSGETNQITDRNSDYGKYGYGDRVLTYLVRGNATNGTGTRFSTYIGTNIKTAGVTNLAEFSTYALGSYHLTPTVRIQNYGAVANRHKSVARYGTISDQITGGQAAAWANGGSGICVYLTPSSATAGNTLDWEFFVPVTASTAFTLSFYTKLTSTTTPSTLTCTIYDSDDDLTKLLNAESVSMTDSWGEYTSTSCTPTNTGFCRVVLKALKGASATSIGIDDVHTT